MTFGRYAAHPATLIILALTAIKVALIVASCMEINRAPRWLQMLCGAWTMAVFGILAYTLCARV
ncbi:cytochrome C oxidase subunit IV family protein [Mycobacterium sp. D16Q16]|uniref:cytochrome C oxidase subunit IV family protein n=1 Tax=Mycobacterium sp. D16Q16 TaxID=1855659 RepID=UPI0009927C28|nr:cytochrome C oxidase subunit IV family protein [Mycobacterium sp. D16Q16]